jgi:hypothetical protein
MATKSLTPRLTSVLASIRKPHFQLRCTYVGNRDRRLRHSIPAASSSFLQPERVRFNFDLDILYLDISQEEEGLHHFFGVLKESELIRLKYVAIDEAYLFNGVVDLHLTIAGLKRALKAMTDLKEMIVVHDITIRRPNYDSLPRTQIKFYTEHKIGEAEENWPANVEELPDVQKEHRDWKLSNVMKMTAVYGWRASG